MNEVDVDGNVVHLTCLDAPPEVINFTFYFCTLSICRGMLVYLFKELMCIFSSIQDVVEHNETKISNQMNKSYASEIESFRSLAGDSDVQCLEALIKQVTSGKNEDNISPIVLSASSDKSHRTVSYKFDLFNMCICIIALISLAV